MWTKEIWPQATEIANVIGSQLRAQRCIPRQTMMANISGSDEDFFKISIGIKMLDFVISDLKTRFGPDQLMVSKMQNKYGPTWRKWSFTSLMVVKTLNKRYLF